MRTESGQLKWGDHLSARLPACATNVYMTGGGSGTSREESGEQDSRCQFVGSSFVSGELVELRSFFLGGKTGDDAQLSESDGSSESGLERFLPRSSASRSSIGVGEGDTEALE